jgi:catechol 2,3-dioxygenase-like lactoylglutathione lyase family enzyme
MEKLTPPISSPLGSGVFGAVVAHFAMILFIWLFSFGATIPGLYKLWLTLLLVPIIVGIIAGLLNGLLQTFVTKDISFTLAGVTIFISFPISLILMSVITLDYNIDMTLQRMDNVLIVVEDLEAAKAFFVELGMELEGETTVEGPWVDRIVGLENVRSEIAMMRTPDGHGRIELDKFHTPAAVRTEPKNAPVNTLGIRRIMFAVDDIEDVLARLRAHGAELIGEVVQYEDMYRLCYIRGPEGIIIALAEQLG